MALQMIVGGASSGKTKKIVADVAKRAAEHPEETFFVIVPEQATLNMQQRVVRQLQGRATLNIDVVSFDRLAHVVFSDLGIDASNVLDDTGKILILKQILEECEEELAVYRSKVHLPGFSQRIKSAITEVKQYGIDDNTLFLMQERAAEQNNRLLFSKLADLRLVLRKFDEQMKGTYRAAEEQLALFADNVVHSARIRNAHIYLDGFTGFTPVQYRLLSRFFTYAKDVTVTLTVPENKIRANGPEYELFHLSNETYTKLTDLAGAANVNVLPPLALADARGEGSLSCELFTAPDLQEEIVFTAKEIARLVSEEGYRYREIAVVATDMEAYHAACETVFSEAGIPCFIDHKSHITENPLARFLVAAVKIKEQRFSFESVFSYLKTGLSSLSEEEVYLLENYCLEFGIRGERAWKKDFTRNRLLYQAAPKQEDEAAESYEDKVWNLDDINAMRQTFVDEIKRFIHDIGKRDASAIIYAAALKQLLQSTQMEQKIKEKAEALDAEGRKKEYREYTQIYGQVTGLLDKIEFLSGSKPMSASDFRMLLESALSEIKVGIIPPTMDMLMVGDLTRTRLDYVKVLFLVGVNDGKIPQVTEPQGIFSTRDRAFLKTAQFEIAPAAIENMYNQRFYLYLMLNKPTEKLYVTYAGAGADGAQLEPAYIIEELPELIPHAIITRRTEMPQVKWQSQALRELSGQIRKDPDQKLMEYFAAEEPQLLRRMVDAAYYSNAQTALDEQVALDLYGEVLSGSVSRYEKYSECPFKHFLSYGIRLEPRPEYEIAATDAGTIYHNALELYAHALEANGTSFRDVSEEESRRIAKESMEQAVSAMPSDVLDSSARNAFLVRRMSDVLVKTTDVLREQVKAGLYEPAQYELEFQQSLNENVRFKGKIDRVDIYDGEDVYIKIIDYKSGQKQFKITDIYAGLQLQLVAYLKEAITHYQEVYPERSVKPGGVYYYLINDKFAKDQKEAAARFKLSGLTSCEEGMVEAVDANLADNPGADSTIVPVKYNKDGSFSQASLVANSQEFGKLMRFVGDKIACISEEIRAGNISVAPHFEQERKNACTYCDYIGICKFEPGSFGSTWKTDCLKAKEEVEKEIYGRIPTE